MYSQVAKTASVVLGQVQGLMVTVHYQHNQDSHPLFCVCIGNISGRKLKTKLRHFSEFKTVHFLLI